jgi:flagellar biosynthesis/type III secretory pathway protein FliH
MSRPLLGVVQSDPAAPLPPTSAVGLSAEEIRAFRQADEQRKLMDEMVAIQRVLGNVAQASQQLHTRQHQLVAQMQKATVELALAVAGWLVRKKIEVGEYPLETVIREALQRLGPARPAAICLHPDDLRLLEKRVAQPLFAAQEDVKAVADPTMKRGDCQVRAGDIEVLSQIDEHLAGIRDSLLRELDHAQSADRTAVENARRS